MNISKLLPNDIQKIVDLELKIFGTSLGQLYLSKNIDNQYFHYYVMKENDIIIGYIGASLNDQNLMLENFVIDKEFIGRGLGTKLLDYLIKQTKPSSIILEVRQDNHRAISFYEKNGFCQILIKPNYYQDCDALVYQRKW